MDASKRPVSDVNILESAVLPAPEFLCRSLNRTEEVADYVADARATIRRILFGDDPRLLVIIGPCSIHDPAAGLEFARRLADLKKEVRDRIYPVMRVYFEKPRTKTGWKGLIMDPDLDGTCDLPKGLQLGRQFLLDVLSLGLATATELLDPITPQYISDLVCWSAIGARTTESQTHRQMASGLSMPLGFKNSTSGDVQVALNAVEAAGRSQTFLGISHQGLASALTTRGNPHCHLVLRGGNGRTNFDAASVTEAANAIEKRGLPPAVMVDCSHDNSGKDPARQAEVFRNVVAQAAESASPVRGAMLESNLISGNQPFPQPLDQLTYGMSITDACLDWETTADLLREAHQRLG